MKKITQYFFNGLLFLVPIALTLYILYLVFIKIDSILRIPIPGIGVIPGVGFVATFIIVTLIGILVSNFLTRRLLLWFDHLLNRLPLVKLIYSSIKDLINAFFGDKKTFNQPVRVRLSMEGTIWAIGFITNESLKQFGLEDFVAVYLPQSYNFAGNLVLVAKTHIEPIEASGSELMTFVVSGGVAAG